LKPFIDVISSILTVRGSSDDGPNLGPAWLLFNKRIHKSVLVVIGDFIDLWLIHQRRCSIQSLKIVSWVTVERMYILHITKGNTWTP